MRKYIAKRIIINIFILFFVSFIIYTIMRFLPTTFVENMARERASMPGGKSYQEWLSDLNKLYNLDRGIIPGFFGWLGDALRGNFGDSWYFFIPVTEKFIDVIWYSFWLNVVVLILQVVIAIPLGIISARKQYSKTDYAITIFALLGISLPGFFFATVLKLIFSVKLGWLELFGAVSRNHEAMSSIGKFFDLLSHYIMPIITLVTLNIGGLMRYTRTNMLEVLNSDYIRTARAKGLSENKVINRHAFRNTLIPIVTIIGGTLPGLFAGAMITETLFQIPGIGYVSLMAIMAGDIPMTMFYLVFGSLLTLLGTLIADILYAVVDPRVRIS